MGKDLSGQFVSSRQKWRVIIVTHFCQAGFRALHVSRGPIKSISSNCNSNQTARRNFFVVSSCCRKQRKIGSFLREVVEAFRFLSVRFSLEYLSGVTRKRLTRDIIETVFPVPLYRSIFQASPGQDVLSRVEIMAIPPGIKTFFSFTYTQTPSL